MSHYYLNEDKTYTPCDLLTWANQLESMDRRVAQDEINGARVSTVWLGTDHNLADGKPYLLETMIFKDKESIYCQRYSTWQEAEEGHKKAIQWVLYGANKDE